MNARGWIARVRAAAKGLAARLRRQPRPAMVGIPPSARKIPAIPADPAEHAVQFAHTWAGRLEHHVEGRMHALDIPERTRSGLNSRALPFPPILFAFNSSAMRRARLGQEPELSPARPPTRPAPMEMERSARRR